MEDGPLKYAVECQKFDKVVSEVFERTYISQGRMYSTKVKRSYFPNGDYQDTSNTEFVTKVSDYAMKEWHGEK